MDLYFKTGNKADHHLKPKTGLIFLYYFAFACFIFGIKLCFINKYANATPFIDDWDAEGNLLYKPFIDGTLKFTDFLAPYNEHRLFTSRLLSLSELILNGIWNPLLQMVINAGIHVLAMIVLIALMTRVVGHNYLPALLGFSALLFGLPFGWENTLSGFQEEYYFVILFSIVCLWFTTIYEPFSFWWNFGLFSSILAFFSLASGIFCLAASTVLGIIFYLFRLRKTNRQLAAIILMAGLFITGFALTPAVAWHQHLIASSVPQFIKALTTILCWPSPNLFLGLLQNGPLVIFGVLMFKKRPYVNNRKWFLIVMIVWMLGTASSIAYGRADYPLTSRYMDLFTVSILTNFSCLLVIFEECKTKFKKWPFFSLMIWVLSVGLSLQLYTQTGFVWYADSKMPQEINTRNYVATGDISNLENKPFIHIPYPADFPSPGEGVKHLARILDIPEIRSILPSNIAPPDRSIKEGRFDKAVNALIANYYVFIGISLLSLVACGLLEFFAAAKKGKKMSV
jgi:hypothetical protein